MTGRQTETDRHTETERQTENSNWKTLILKDSSFRSIWTCLTASLAILRTQINTTIPQTDIISTIKRERARERESDRQTDIDRDRDRQTDIDRDRERHRKTETERKTR